MSEINNDPDGSIPEPQQREADRNKIREAAALLGRKGGKAGTGKAKARTPEQARAASLVRWDKVKTTGKEDV